MTDDLGRDVGEDHSVLTALGLDADTDYAVPEHLWTTALSVALDPDTPAVDTSNVPIMDDHGTVPDTDDAHVTDHTVHHEVPDHDTGLHDPAAHDADHIHLDTDHDMGGHDGTGHDGGAHDPGGHDPGPHGTDWHV
ncbi:hypothetical protein ACQ7HM_07105 [Williamsia sp. MIQD14]|uniref:hypothetical protein n=1 Tax=Williamsia sp. MIQD14 TaxID=3425703 RepID=UPI003D9FE615